MADPMSWNSATSTSRYPTTTRSLVQVQAAGLHRGDWHVMTGLPYLIRLVVPDLGLRKPKVPVRGMDVAGTRRGGRPQRDPVPAW